MKTNNVGRDDGEIKLNGWLFFAYCQITVFLGHFLKKGNELYQQIIFIEYEYYLNYFCFIPAMSW